MSNIKSFSVTFLDSLLKQHGLKKTWQKILFTHAEDLKFQQILESDEFRGVVGLPSNIIRDLSIGEISVLYEYCVSKMNQKKRKTDGQYFTPDDVSQFMASQSKTFPNGVWLDPCTGVGNLSWHLIASQKNPEKFLSDNLIATDKDELALLIARTLLTISFQKENENLFKSLKNKFIRFDFLSVSDSGEKQLFASSSGIENIPKHDFVIVNPPYLSTKVNTLFETAKSGDLYSYFLENVIKSSKGFISITPQSFTNAKKFDSLRKLLISKFSSLKIFNFDNVPGNIFLGIKFGSTNSNQVNSIRAAITVAEPGEGQQVITTLIRWRSHERKLLFKNLGKFLCNVPLSEEFFPKVGPEYKKLYLEMINLKRLSTLLSSQKTKYPLFIPSAPRYFISALKKPVRRSSQKIIYFSNEIDRDFAYMIINSSLMYWWWRVRDGGMTLSLETIYSLPLPNFSINKKIIDMLELSERKSKVYKQNAGVAQENVKHPKHIIDKLNKLVIPKYSNLVGKLHNNSDLANLLIDK